jgi:hypothetical protein
VQLARTLSPPAGWSLLEVLDSSDDEALWVKACVKLIPRRAGCRQVFAPPMHLIDSLRSLISKELSWLSRSELKGKPKKNSRH